MGEPLFAILACLIANLLTEFVKWVWEAIRNH